MGGRSFVLSRPEISLRPGIPGAAERLCGPKGAESRLADSL